MTEQENNVLIAKFMFPHDKTRDTYWVENRLSIFIPHGTYMLEDMHFNESWDWLVPVIAKINKTDTTVSPLHLTEMNYYMQRNELDKAIDAVVKWIRRYNQDDTVST